jgi:hypothetical protein
MSVPNPTQFNNPNYYKYIMPPVLGRYRLWQLAYGEFRAPKYIAVMRARLKRFDWDDFDLVEAVELYKLLQVWAKIPDVRRKEWPTFGELVVEFRTRLLDSGDGIEAMHQGGMIPLDWINDDAEWNRLVEQPYALLHP